MNAHRIVPWLREHLPQTLPTPALIAVYAFGSRVAGTARPDSDLDLAVLLAGRADPVRLWELSQALATELGCDVDLVDFGAASTVLQHQILMNGQRWWCGDAAAADAYEAYVCSEKLALDEARAPLLADIQREGSVHAR